MIGVAVIVMLLSAVAGAMYLGQLRRHNDRLQKLADSESKAQQRAAANLVIARQTVKDMADIAANDLSDVPQLDATRRQVLQKALALQEKLLTQDVADADSKRDVAEAARFAGDLYQLLGDHSAAERHLKTAADLHRELVESAPDNPSFQSEWAQDLVHLSHVQWQHGRASDAASSLAQADALLDPLIRRFPDEPAYKFLRARVYLNQGRLFGEGPNPGASEQRIVQARELLLELVAKYPGELRYRERLATSWTNLGVTLAALGRSGESVFAYEHAGEILAEIVDDNPRQRNNRWMLAQLYSNYGNQLWTVGRKKASALAYASSQEQMRRLTQEFPDIPEYRHSLAQSLENSGFMLFRAEGFRGGESFWEQAISLDVGAMCAGAMQRQEAFGILAELTDKYPDVTAYRASLGYVAVNHGIWHRNREQWSLALNLFQTAVLNIRGALRPDPTNRRHRLSLGESLWYQAEMLLRLNRLDEAAALAQESAVTWSGDHSYYYYAAQITAQCFQACADKSKKQDFLKITLDLLRQPAEKRRNALTPATSWGGTVGGPLLSTAQRGWFEANLIRTLPEFGPLLSSPMVQECLRELER